MAAITVKNENIEQHKGVVILPVAEYRRLLMRSAPAHHLTGTEAVKLDRLVSAGLREHRSGKAKKIISLTDLE